MKKPERIAAVTLASLAVFFTTLWALQSTPYAIGIDGYYYAAQTRSYLEKGRFFASDASWVLYAMAWFSRLGSDIVVMNKVFVALISVAIFWSVNALLRLFAPRQLAICLAAAVLASSYVQFCRTNFVKNLVGLVFLILLLRQVLLPLQKRSGFTFNAPCFFFTAAAFLGCAASHTQTAFIATLPLLVLFLHFLRPRMAGKPTWRRGALLAAIAVSLLLAILIYKNRARFAALQLPDLFVLNTVFPLHLMQMNAGNARLGAEAMALFAVNLVFLARYAWRLLRQRVTGAHETLVALLIVVTANPFYSAAESQWGFRLHLISIVPTTIALVMLLPERSIPRLSRLPALAAYALTALLIAASHVQLLHNVRQNRIDYAEVEAAVERLALPERHLLIAHQGFDYFYCYRRKGDAFHFLAEEKHRGRDIYRVLHGFPAVTLRGVNFTQPPITLTKNYALIREVDFDKVTAKLSPMEKKLLLTFRNPTNERDLFLRLRESTRTGLHAR